MKKIKNLNILSVVLLATVLLFSCKKGYNLDHKDGTDEIGKPTASITVDTSIKIIDASKYPQARIFPGLVCTTEPRINTQVTLNLNKKYVASDLKISLPPQPTYSTGLYAAPGELVIITVPDGVYSLSVQIGAWTDNLSNVENAPRDEVIFLRSNLAAGKNYFRNLYGGHIYILSWVSIATPVKLSFSNVVKSPDFVLGETSNAEWMNLVKNSCVPWLEMRSKNMIFTLPTVYCKEANITDPTALMQEWDDAISLDYYQWQGLSDSPVDTIDRVPLLPWRVVQDIKPVTGYAHTGFPVVTQNDIYWFNEFTDINNIRGLGSSDRRSCWGTFQELGYNNQQTRYWSWSTLLDVTCNFFSFKVARRQERKGNLSAWPPAHPDLSSRFSAALAFAMDSTIPDKNFEGIDPRIKDPLSKLTPFIQIFEKVPVGRDYDGYSIVTELYKKARRATGGSTSDQLKRDFFYETVCEFTQLDWSLFFLQWGIRISNISTAKMARLYQPLKQKIWEYDPLTRTGGNGNTADNPYDRRNWKIESFSSEEASGEGAGNGIAKALIDGNRSTYWHSRWSPLLIDPPHVLVINFGSVLQLKGFGFLQRSNGSTNIKNLVVEYSTDNISYRPVIGSPFALDKTVDKISKPIVDPIQARYIKLTMPTIADNHGGNAYTSLAEFEIIR